MSDGDERGDIGFEAGLAALEHVVAQLESGALSLEEALVAFENGVALVRALRERLEAAERRVEVLTRAADGSLRVEPLDEDDQ